MPLLPQLPAYGWSTHSEQIDIAALEARVWQMSTQLVGGLVISGLIPTVRPEEILKLEAIAQHALTCRDPSCQIGLGYAAQLCPGGKFNPAVQVFFTTARDLSGSQIAPLCAVALTPDEAKKNHFAACAILTGAVTSWAPFEDKQA